MAWLVTSMYRAQFGACIPVGFNRILLSEKSKSLAEKVNEAMFHKIREAGC